MAIVWDQERMTTGVPEIDREHQELIQRFNEFHVAMTKGRGREAAAKLLTFIVEYTETHFGHEEKLMSEMRCPAAAANLAAHNALRRQIEELKPRLKEGQLSLTDLVNTERMLGEWLRNHICAIDVKLRGCVHKDK